MENIYKITIFKTFISYNETLKKRLISISFWFAMCFVLNSRFNIFSYVVLLLTLLDLTKFYSRCCGDWLIFERIKTKKTVKEKKKRIEFLFPCNVYHLFIYKLKNRYDRNYIIK